MVTPRVASALTWPLILEMPVICMGRWSFARNTFRSSISFCAFSTARLLATALAEIALLTTQPVF